MQPRTCIAVVALSIALLTPMGVGWLTVEQGEPGTRFLPAKSKEDSKPEEQLATVLVASRPIPAGTFIAKPELWFETKELPKSRIPDSAITNLERIRQLVAAKTFVPGSTVCPDDLLKKEGGNQTNGVPKGKRAITIRVSHDDCVAFQPGSRVAVLNTVKGGDKEGYTQTILEDMLILAADPIDNSAPKGGSGPRYGNVTLAATPEECETLALAQQMGSLHLSNPNTLLTGKRALTLRFSHPGCLEFHAGSKVHVKYILLDGMVGRLTSEPLLISATDPSNDPKYNIVTFLVTREQAEELSLMPAFCELRLVRPTPRSDDP
jgi:Flp pilus assembly protein CpaB